MITVSKGFEMTRAQLRKITIPPVSFRSERWKGVNHGELADTIIRRCKEAQLKVIKETWFVNTTETTLYGAVDIDPMSIVDTFDIGTPASFSMGIRHSNDGRYAITMGVGARIFLCQNGMMTAEFIVKKKHMDSVNLDDLIDDGISEYVGKCNQIEATINAYRSRQVSNTKASHVMMETHRDGLLAFKYLEYVSHEWYNPTHKEFNDRSAWSLYNCFTQVAQTMSPQNQMKLLKGLHPTITRVLAIDLPYSRN